VLEWRYSSMHEVGDQLHAAADLPPQHPLNMSRSALIKEQRNLLPMLGIESGVITWSLY